MNVIVQSQTMVITEGIRAFALRQLKRLSSRGQKIQNVRVFLETIARKKNDAHAATAKVYIDIPGKRVVVQRRAKDLYFALSEAAKHAVQQVSRVKERKHDFKMNRFRPA